MARPEPFRDMLEQAFLAESNSSPPMPIAPAGGASSQAPPAALERRLDQLYLAGGVTPPRGIRGPAFLREVPIRLEPPPVVDASRATPESSSHSARELESTMRMPAAAVDAALRDALAATASSRESPQPPRRIVLPPDLATNVARATSFEDVAPTNPSHRDSIGSCDETTEKRPMPRPPPLPKRAKQNAPESPAGQSSKARGSAPPPRMVQVLGDATVSGIGRSTSSASGKVISRSDFYRLQAELDDAPVRALPPLASLLPMPLLPPTLGDPVNGDGSATDPFPFDVEGNGAPDAVLSATTHADRLEDLECIQDLDALARAVGLKGVGDVSIHSAEGAPLLLDDEVVDLLDDQDLQIVAERREATPPAAAVARPLEDSAAHPSPPRTGVRGDTPDDAFGANDDRSSSKPRPALEARAAAVPVIVRIPARPKVSAEAKSQARKLYLTALEELGRRDKVAAIGHLKLAIHYDDGVQLYRDLLAQLERGRSEERQPEASAPTRAHSVKLDASEAPALLVMKSSGSLTAARDEWSKPRRG